jgi:hypothetical protein
MKTDKHDANALEWEKPPFIRVNPSPTVVLIPVKICTIPNKTGTIIEYINILNNLSIFFKVLNSCKIISMRKSIASNLKIEDNPSPLTRLKFKIVLIIANTKNITNNLISKGK